MADEATTTTAFAALLAAHLESQAPQLAARWQELVSVAIRVRPRAQSAAAQIGEHGAAIIRDVAAFVAAERATPDSAMLRRLGDIARHRRDRGHGVEELLGELGLLAEVLHDSLYEQCSLVAAESAGVAAAARGLHRGLAATSTIIAGLYEVAEQRDTSNERERRQNFASSLAHELKNPLGAAAGALLNLGDEALAADPDSRARMLELAQRNIERALELLDDLRALDSPSRREALETPKPVRDVIDSVLVEVSEAAGEAGVRIEVRDPVPDVALPGAAGQLALVNLVWNAVKYSDSDKADRFVEISASDFGSLVEILVRDNGVGIPADRRDEVFERFARIHPERSNGSGLGLAIAREAVEAVGGELDFESEVGNGSTFRIALPRA